MGLKKCFKKSLEGYCKNKTSLAWCLFCSPFDKKQMHIVIQMRVQCWSERHFSHFYDPYYLLKSFLRHSLNLIRSSLYFNIFLGS